MAAYAVGDVQGCYAALRRLVETLRFDPARDRLWLTGDLVNRGPDSVAVLRYVRGLGDRAVTVLGNHDLHLLAVAAGRTAGKPQDTLWPVLAAPDREELLGWLRRRPLLHHDPATGATLVHAGLLPAWDLAQAGRLAAEVEAVLAGESYADLLEHMYGDGPRRWDEKLSGWPRLRVIVNAFTRLRYCEPDGAMRLELKCAPDLAPAGVAPWFALPGRRTTGHRIVFGHWSTLGRYRGRGVVGLDTGCVWGGRLTAVRLAGALTDFTSVDCPAAQTPGD